MRRSFTAKATNEAIIRLIPDAVEFMKENGLVARSLYVGELVLEEILTNIVKYAYSDPGGHQIEVDVEVKSGQVSFEFRDKGKPFDPLSVPAPKTGEPVKTQPIGGRGIYLVKIMVKESHYRREHGRNILKLVFPARSG